MLTVKWGKKKQNIRMVMPDKMSLALSICIVDIVDAQVVIVVFIQQIFIEHTLWANLVANVQFSSVQFSLFVTPWTAACQTSLSITNSWSLLKLTSIELVMPSNHYILCRPLLLLPSFFPSITVFFSESVLHLRWPKDCSFSFSSRYGINACKT